VGFFVVVGGREARRFEIQQAVFCLFNSDYNGMAGLCPSSLSRSSPPHSISVLGQLIVQL